LAPINEKELAAYYHVGHVISCGNGTNALELSLRALGIGPGDEVITSAYSWISAAHAISLVGAKPVFVDVAENTFQMDLNKIEENVTSKTKAILPVHLYGEPYNMPELKHLADKHNLFVLEDAAQYHGYINSGINLIQYSDIAIQSFYPTKQLGAYGDAGAILTNNESFAQKIRKLANYGADFPGRNYEFPGTNSRLDQIQAAILRVKLKFLDSWVIERRNIARIYSDRLKKLAEITAPNITDDHRVYLYTILTEKRDELGEFLSARGIKTSVNYDFVIPHTEAHGRQKGFENSLKISKECLNLPCYPELKSDQIHYVCDCIESYFC
jgi:dTDP-4-amino-4,6-dideoxygalactose transaminase